MSTQLLLKECLTHWKDISELNYCLLYPDESIFIHTDPRQLVPDSRFLQDFISSENKQTFTADEQIFKIFSNHELLYLLYIYGNKQEAQTIGQLAVCQVESLLESFQQKIDKNTFMRNLLLGNYSETDYYNLTKKLRISIHTPRVIFIIETKQTYDENALSTIKNIFSSKSKDFVMSLGNHEIIIVKELEETSNITEIYQLAYMLVDMLNTEVMTPAWVSFSHITSHLDELPYALQDAKISLEIGKIFYSQKNVFCYEDLGIGRLLYNIPDSVCRDFIREIFHAESANSIDPETLHIIKTFFENNLNLSETARQLFVHRNTLLYRLEKIQKKYNLDLRSFEDALTFKLGLMVSDYLEFQKRKAD